MSKWLFMRHYLWVVLLILMVGWGMDRVLEYENKQETLTSDTHFLQGSFLYIETFFDMYSQNIPEIWAEKHLKIQAELGYPLAMYQLSDFSDVSQLTGDLRTKPVVALSADNEGITYYRRLANSDYVVALGPIYQQYGSIPVDVVLIMTYHLLIASVLFLWFAPLSRDLQKLRKVTSSFGEDNFSARIKLGKNSSIAQVADAFNIMAQRIQTLVSAHKDLTHAVSHELKTPLARFKFSLEIIEGLDDKQKRSLYLKGMKQDVRELDELINEMLSYARLDVNNLTLNLQAVPAELWLKELVNQHQQDKIHISYSLDIQVAQQPALLIDRHLMDRAVNNLIRNGLRYAENVLRLSLYIAEDVIKLCVDDDGPGIPEQYREQVFQPFMRLETSRDKQSGGYGLGLSMVKKIVQQHGGQVTVTTSVLGGAEFCMSWPVQVDGWVRMNGLK